MFKNIKRFIKSKSSQIDKIENVEKWLNNDLKSPKVNLGQLQSYFNNQRASVKSLHEVEFQVFSQWGDDGIIQYLVNHIDIPNKTFIEFGVENYKESNTRFLLVNNNWSGLVIDGSAENIDFIKKDSISWAFDIHAKHSFITRENINGLISEFLNKGYDKEIGILSVDIDGNDYWVWKEINVVNPVIVIVEYNAVFGDKYSWTIPYKKDFYRVNEHNSYQYWGASLNAFCQLGEQKGYHFIGCNSNANNAYFIRKDKIAGFTPISCAEGYVESKFREYIDKNGERMGGKARFELLRGLKIYNTLTDKVETI